MAAPLLGDVALPLAAYWLAAQLPDEPAVIVRTAARLVVALTLLSKRPPPAGHVRRRAPHMAPLSALACALACAALGPQPGAAQPTTTISSAATWAAGTYRFDALVIDAPLTITGAVVVQAGNITLTSNGAIVGNGGGFPAQSGPCWGTASFPSYGQGGSHGGCGDGDFFTCPTQASSGYGDFTAPGLAGCGGTNGGGTTGCRGGAGGAGGAAITLNATDLLVLHGAVSVNGATAVDGNGVCWQGGGGGAGGSIFLRARRLAGGAGSLSAAGGNGGVGVSAASSSAGGGGGRIAIVCAELAAPAALSLLSVSAVGGVFGRCPTCPANRQYAGTGTVYVDCGPVRRRELSVLGTAWGSGRPSTLVLAAGASVALTNATIRGSSAGVVVTAAGPASLAVASYTTDGGAFTSGAPGVAAVNLSPSATPGASPTPTASASLGSSGVYAFTARTPCTVYNISLPPTAPNFTVHLWGAGGAGFGFWACYAGGPGGYVRGTFVASAGDVFRVTVGTAGVAGAGNAISGPNCGRQRTALATGVAGGQRSGGGGGYTAIERLSAGGVSFVPLAVAGGGGGYDSCCNCQYCGPGGTSGGAGGSLSTCASWSPSGSFLAGGGFCESAGNAGGSSYLDPSVRQPLIQQSAAGSLSPPVGEASQWYALGYMGVTAIPVGGAQLCLPGGDGLAVIVVATSASLQTNATAGRSVSATSTGSSSATRTGSQTGTGSSSATATGSSSATGTGSYSASASSSSAFFCADARFVGRATLTAGDYHTCVLSMAGSVACWGAGTGTGYGHYGQTTVPATVATSVQVAVAAGYLHTCALSAAGGVTCWGYNLGQTTVPAAGSIFVAIATGGLHTCALSSAGGVVCWGYNVHDQMVVPAVATSGQLAVAAGGYHTCTLSAAGGVACWGRDDYGQATVPASVATSGQVSVVAGWGHTCALSAVGSVACWGAGTGTGYGHYGQTIVPAAVAAMGQVALAAGWSHTCALSATGGVVCWGSNSNGQANVPASVLTGQVAVAAGGAHTCALASGGRLTCWGWNDNGQTAVPLSLTDGGVALPCRLAGLSDPTSSVSPSATSRMHSASSSPAVPSGSPGSPGIDTSRSSSETATSSSTGTETSRVSSTATSSVSSTSSQTGTASSSSTASRSSTASQTGTPSSSATASVTSTASQTGTPSSSATASRSGTGSQTGTPSSSATASRSGTGSQIGRAHV